MDMEINVFFICWSTKYFLIVILIVGMFSLRTDASCPHICECKWKSGKESVECLNVNLTRIPTNLDSSTQVLDITGNDVTEIEHDAFSNAGLLNLQKIFIAKCRLKFLHRFSFRNLINLVELDMSYNILNSVPTYTFDSIFELRELKLNGNPIQKIKDNAFVHLSQLVRLELSDCKLITIEQQAFAGLDVLEWLKIDGNKLIYVQYTSFRSLQNLKGIELARNWWNCTCHMRPVREWVLREKISYTVSPVCRTPPRLSNKLWNNLDLDEFVCPPSIFATNNSNRYTAKENMNVTVSCHIQEGEQFTDVKWMLRNKIVTNYTANTLMAMSSTNNRQKSYVVKNNPWVSNLTVIGADVHDTGIYTCFVKNKAGQAEANAYLNIVKADSVHILYSQFLIIFVVILTLIIVTLLTAMAIWYKAQKKRYNWNLKKDKTSSYEKIELSYNENNPTTRPTMATTTSTTTTTTTDNRESSSTFSKYKNSTSNNNNNNNSDHRKNGIAILQDTMSSSSLPFETQFYSPIKRNGYTHVPTTSIATTMISATTNDDDFAINEENFYYSIKGDNNTNTKYRKPIENFPPTTTMPTSPSTPTRTNYTWQNDQSSILQQNEEIDLHIPRLSDKKWIESPNVHPDDDLINWSSASNHQYDDTKILNIPAYLMKKRTLKDLRGGLLYTTEESSFISEDSFDSNIDRKPQNELEYPDLLNTAGTSTRTRCYKSDIYCIDNKIVNDNSSNAFSTLPRKRQKNSYKKYLKTISDSQSSSLVPLSAVGSTSSLNKYNSNSNLNLYNLYQHSSVGGVAAAVATTLPRRFANYSTADSKIPPESDGSNVLTTESHAKLFTQNIHDENDGKPLSSLATPLLDFTTLQSYPKIPSSSASTINKHANPYTCKPSSELDSFLEEYQNLQSQLYKMKEACNVIQQQKDEKSKYSNINTLLNSNSNSSKCMLPTEQSSPDTTPYWMQRNEMLKRLNKQDGSFYQS